MKNQKALLLALAVLTMWGLQPPSAYAQVDLSGQWGTRQHEDSLERGGGPGPGEYEGLPINDADRFRADSWTASLWTVPQHQCIPHPADYGPNFSNLQIWRELSPYNNTVVAWHTQMAWMTPTRTIWMDNRERPPAYAAHTWEGFSLGKWEGDMLTVETTHFKPAYVRRDGLARSEKGTLREHFIRNGNVLSWISIVTDPVYLTEPYIKSRNFYYDPGIIVPDYPCWKAVEIPRPAGVIPHYLPGTNPAINEWAIANHLPAEAGRGGAETMYPEFMEKVKKLPNAKPAAAADTTKGKK